MKSRREKGKADFERAKAQAEEQARKHKYFEDALQEMSRKSNLNERELAELKRQFEAERRKSMSIEEAIVRLQRDNKGKAAELQELQSQLAENKEEI